jgi:rubrerythrin
MELSLALEYLYARYTVAYYDTKLGSERQHHAEFIAHELLNVAIGEMMHLRWANELLRELGKLMNRPSRPMLTPARKVPRGARVWGEAEERALDDAIDDFVAAEAPSGTLEGVYARILAQLQRGLPNPGDVRPDLIGLVERIVADGVDHYSKFREVQAILRQEGAGLVSHLKKVAEGSDEFREAVRLYERLFSNLMDAFQGTGATVPASFGAAHRSMKSLDQFAEDLARRGLAIPLLEIAIQVSSRAS